jgi:hypothetical protein
MCAVCRYIVQLPLVHLHHCKILIEIDLYAPSGREFLGLCLPNLLRSASPQGQQREARRVLLSGSDGGHIEDVLLQRKQRNLRLLDHMFVFHIGLLLIYLFTLHTTQHDTA